MMMLNLSCNFCHQRKRRCDGLAERHCSFCASRNRAECHYSRRRAPSRTPATSKSRPVSSSARDPGHDDDAVEGKSFWRMDLDGASGEDDGRVQGLSLPLKRGQFSASPATGLIGLQENQFLGDFFECLGFLALTNQSTVRNAMVRIMLSDRPPQHPRHHQRYNGPPSPFQPSPIRCRSREADKQGLVGEGSVAARKTDFDEINTNVDGSCWSNVLAAESGAQILPRDSSTCILWCAVALGALVRGHPLVQVGRYADLAEDSLRTCRDATLDTARAYVATAVLHDFLGHPVKTHEYLEIASNIADQLPPERIPKGFHGLLQYAGMTWTLDTDLASAEDIEGYWENASPIWELSESVIEQDICGLVLSTCVRMNQHFVDATGINRVVFAEEPQPQPQPQPRPRAVKPEAPRPSMEKAERQDAELTVGDSSELPSAEVAAVKVDETNIGNVVASAEIPRSVLPEMLRVQEYFQSSNMHLGVGGLLYYSGLAYLQALNNEDSTTSFVRSVDVMLRYPGLCRYKSWLWIAHSHLFMLAFSHQRCKYEEVRASYNSVRPPGSSPAPPFEEFRGISDICDHAHCRRTAERAQCALAS